MSENVDANNSNSSMFVINRHGKKEDVSFDQILGRIRDLSYNLHSLVDPARVAQNVINGVRTRERTEYWHTFLCLVVFF